MKKQVFVGTEDGEMIRLGLKEFAWPLLATVLIPTLAAVAFPTWCILKLLGYLEIAMRRVYYSMNISRGG